MAIEYAGDPTYHPNVTVVDDGDPPVAASFAAGLQDCADRETYLKRKADAFDAADAQLAIVCPGYSTGGYTVPVGPADLVGGTGAIGQLCKWIGTVTPSDTVTMQLNLPVGSRIVQVAAFVTGVEWGSLPSQGNVIEIVEYDPPSDTSTTIDRYTDVPPDLSTMNSKRSIGHVLATPYTVAAARSYFMIVHGTMGGSNAGPIDRSVTLRSAFVVVKK